MAEGRFGSTAKGEPVIVVHVIDEDSVLLIPEDSILGVPGSIILDHFEDAVVSLISPTLPEVKEGLVNGVLRKE